MCGSATPPLTGMALLARSHPASAAGHSRAHQQEPGVPSVLKGTLVWFPYLGQYRLRQVVRLTHEDPPGHLEGGAAFADAQPQQRLLVQSTVDDDPGYLAFHCGSASREDPLAPGLWEAQGSQELQAMWRHLRRHSRPPTLAEVRSSRGLHVQTA